jgi:hypothetical protein
MSTFQIAPFHSTHSDNPASWSTTLAQKRRYFTLSARPTPQIIATVAINHVGPYDFLVATGAQVTAVDPALTAELHLKTEGATELLDVGLRMRPSNAHPGIVEVRSHAQANTRSWQRAAWRWPLLWLRRAAATRLPTSSNSKKTCTTRK